MISFRKFQVLGASVFLTGVLSLGCGADANQSADVPKTIAGKAAVVDGDTLEIGGKRVRLYGIDAPEVAQKCTTESGANWECGRRAVEVLAELAENKHVRCDVHKIGQYGRIIATCFQSKIELNAEMVRKCLAWAFLKYTTDYLDLEYRTSSSGCGIWSGANERPWKYRERRWKREKQRAPEGCPIKGNISSNGHIYHTPWSRDYDKTWIDLSAGERWFCSENEAIDAGWRAPKWR